MIPRQRWFDHAFNLDIDVGWTQNVRCRIQDTSLRLAHHVQSISEANLAKKQGIQWSIKEHVGHLVDLESLWRNRFEQFNDRVPELVHADLSNQKTEEADHNAQSIEKLLEDFRQERAKLIACFDALDEAAQRHEALHPRLQVIMKPIDLLFFVAEHDDHHLTSILEIKQHLTK